MVDEALVTARTLRRETLMLAEFRSAPLRLWMGFGLLEAGGHTWRGSGDLITISEIDFAPKAFAAPFTVTLSGLPEDAFDLYTQMFLSDAREYRGRRITFFFQYFDESWGAVGSPEAVLSGLMDIPKMSGEIGSRSVSIQCESPFVTRRRPRYSTYSHQDQQARSGGDRGFEYAPAAASKVLKMPVLPP